MGLVDYTKPVVAFKYTQKGRKSKRYLGRVLGVRDTVKRPVKLASKLARDINRGQYLVTVQDIRDNTVRSFYDVSGTLSNARQAGIVRQFIYKTFGIVA